MSRSGEVLEFPLWLTKFQQTCASPADDVRGRATTMQDHPPPHFHALYAEHEALIDIRTLEVIEGDLPRRALALARE